MNKKNVKEKVSFREKMKDKKYSAKVQLIGYGIFILIIVIYAKFSVSNYDYNYTNDIQNNPENIDDVVSESLLASINNNYDYEIVVDIKEKKDENVGDSIDELTTLKYSGSNYKNVRTIEILDQVYYLKNNNYYKKIEEGFEKVDVTLIYGEFNYKYVELKEILGYLDDAVLDHTTNYSNGKIVSTYYLYLKDILTNYYENDYIEINVSEDVEKLEIEIDYTNLVLQENDNIEEYRVKAIYRNINEVEEFDIEI